MQIVVGKKYKLNKQRMKYYSDKYSWDVNFCSSTLECVTIKYIHTNCWPDDKNIVTTYCVEENPWFYPVDCLIDIREAKIKKVLCIK